MTFDEAIFHASNQQARIRREGWVTPGDVAVEIVSVDGHQVRAFILRNEGSSPELWNPSVSDMFSDDWTAETTNVPATRRDGGGDAHG